MENTEWEKKLFGKSRINKNKIEFIHNNSNETLFFDTIEDLNDYLELYFIQQSELSSSS